MVTGKNVSYLIKRMVIFATIFFSSQASAHVKWFVPLCGPNAKDQFQWSDPFVLICIAFSLSLVLLAINIDKNISYRLRISVDNRQLFFRAFNILVGFSLVASAFNGSILAAHYVANSGFPIFLLYLEAVIGLMLIFNCYLFTAAAMLLVLFVGCMFNYGAYEVIEYINVLGIALFLLLSPQSALQNGNNISQYALPTLRVTAGLALVILAFSEKLLNPTLAISFLQAYEWNFINEMGFYFFSDKFFVLLVGLIEFAIGLILIMGVATRITTTILAVLLLTSNITFLFQGAYPEAILELIGHLPIIATGILLIVFGSGKKLVISNTIYDREVVFLKIFRSAAAS